MININGVEEYVHGYQERQHEANMDALKAIGVGLAVGAAVDYFNNRDRAPQPQQVQGSQQEGPEEPNLVVGWIALIAIAAIVLYIGAHILSAIF